MTDTTQPPPLANEYDEDSHSLPAGTRLGEFELLRKIGEGGFSIVYVAWDHQLECEVALKEYMPSAIASRRGQTHVSARAERLRETFAAGLKSFINEAKLLRQFDHPSLVKIYRFWEGNGTAYMVMPLYQGKTLRDTLRGRAAPPDEAWLLKLLSPLTEALGVLHARQCYHRDIAPDNVILLPETGKPVLLDFGAARRVISDMTQDLTVILKPGYAPIEQYSEVPGLKQGPWTDVYALAATIYWSVMGKTPPPAVGRMMSDSYEPLAERAAGRYSDRFLRAVDAALAVKPDQRIPSIEAFREALGVDEWAAVHPRTVAVPVDDERTIIRPSVKTQSGTAFAPTEAVGTAESTRALPATAGPGAQTVAHQPPDQQTVASRAEPASSLPVTPTQTPRTEPASATQTSGARVSSPWALRAALGLAGLLVLGGGAWWLKQANPPAPAAVSIPPTATPPKPVNVPPVQPPARVLTRGELWSQLLSGQQGKLGVQAQLTTPTDAAGVAAVQAQLGDTPAGYVYVLGYRTGSDDLYLLFPRPGEAAYRVEAGASASLPRDKWVTQAWGGQNWNLLAVVSGQARDPARAGWQVQDGLLHWPPGKALPGDHPADQLLGPASCPQPGGGCLSSYSATEFKLASAAPAAPAQPVATEHAPEPVHAPAKASTKANTKAKTREAQPQAEGRPPANKPQGEGRAGAAAECARILQRISLGDATPALQARLGELGCK